MIVSVFMIMIMSFVFWGCSHKTLTVFFDGVPDQNDSLKIAAKQKEKKIDTAVVAEIAANTVASKLSQHPPFAVKKCALCHDQNRQGKMIESQPGLCYQCHDVYDAKFEHGPVASGNCTACHSPHSSENPKLLLRTGQDLCLNCHESGKLTVTGEHENIGGSPCTDCHNPHGGKKRYFLN